MVKQGERNIVCNFILIGLFLTLHRSFTSFILHTTITSLFWTSSEEEEDVVRPSADCHVCRDRLCAVNRNKETILEVLEYTNRLGLNERDTRKECEEVMHRKLPGCIRILINTTTSVPQCLLHKRKT